MLFLSLASFSRGAVFYITNSETGVVLKLTGDSPPTAGELRDIWAEHKAGKFVPPSPDRFVAEDFLEQPTKKPIWNYIAYAGLVLLAFTPLFFPYIRQRGKRLLSERISIVSALALAAFVASIVLAPWEGQSKIAPGLYSEVKMEYRPIFDYLGPTWRLLWNRLFLHWAVIAIIYVLLLVICWPKRKNQIQENLLNKPNLN